jgi:pPIWI RE three-gene island domain Z
MRERPEFWQGDERIAWLCTFMEACVGTDSLEYAPVLLSGLASVTAAPALGGSRQAAFNLRQLTRSYTTLQSIKHAVALYNDRHYRNRTQGPYRIDPQTLHFERTDPLEDPLIAKARAWLGRSIPLERQSLTMADPSEPMAVALGPHVEAVRVPVGPISAPLAARRTHDLGRRPSGRIRIPVADLSDLADEMDGCDRDHPERRPGNWRARLESFEVLVPDTQKGLGGTNTVELAGIKHLIGLPGAGKTTILMLLAMWLGRHEHRTMLLFPSIQVARQYMTDLAFYGVRVGMLVGQNPTTRRQHAEQVAETIAASGDQAGFGLTLDGADAFAANCVLPAFSTGDTSMWGFGEAPCADVLQGAEKNGRVKKRLCPVWTVCGRNKAPRELVDAEVWVGHVLSMDTPMPAQAVDERLRYFEYIAGTFDVVIFDEADDVQSRLDEHGAAVLSISGSEDSIHRQIQEQIHDRFARGDNHRLYDRNVELFSRELAEFGNHNTSLVSRVQNIPERVSQHFANQLLTTSRLIGEILHGLDWRRRPRRDEDADRDVATGFTRARALTDLWDTAAYTAFYDRTGLGPARWPKADLCARVLGVDRDTLDARRDDLVRLFRRYLAEDFIIRRDAIVDEIAALFQDLCYGEQGQPAGIRDAITLLVAITFMILGYQRIVPGTRALVGEGLIREPIVSSTASTDLRRFIPENILGSFSGVRYSFSPARSTRQDARNVELHYIEFLGAPRQLMHRFHRLLEADGGRPGPAVLLASATSFLDKSPSYHVSVGPHYLLRPRAPARHVARSVYRFKWIPDSARGEQPLRYSGAGDLGERNLERMVDALAAGGIDNSEIFKSIRNFDVQHEVRRKAALVVNSYRQARLVKQRLDDYHRDIGRRTRAVVRSLEGGERPEGYVTPAQVEALGDDDNCDVIVFPMRAIGRGVNVVFTDGPRRLDAAIGSIYFLTRPHPSADDMQLLHGLAGRASQQFDERVFDAGDDLATIAAAWRGGKVDTLRLVRRLLQEPLQASRLGAELFEPFTANQMVAILQTIGRGMRNGCPVAVYFVDAAWAARSAAGEVDSARDSMLVQMRVILEDCVAHPDPVIRAVYRELYCAFLEPLRRVEGVLFPEDLGRVSDAIYDDDGFDESFPLLEM